MATILASSFSSLPTLSEDETASTPLPFDAVKHYAALLEKDDSMAMPIAAVEVLAELIEKSPSTSTTTELFTLLHTASAQLAAASFNPISLGCGTSLFLRFLTLQRPPPELSFKEFKAQLVSRAREFVKGSGKCREAIAENMAEFIKDGSRMLVHGYSRVVVQALLYAAQVQKKRLQVYVTESRPFGLGLKTHAVLSEAGVECMVILDSACAYIMGKVDMCIVGAEAVCESGGLVNFVGGYQMAIAAKAWSKPLYALAESYKFTRVFPLSQFDLPSSLPDSPLSFDTPGSMSVPVLKSSAKKDLSSPILRSSSSSTSPSKSSTAFMTSSSSSSSKTTVPATPSRPMIDSPMPKALEMSDAMIRANPTLDYTTPELIALVVSDLGAMTPSGISDALLGIYGGE